MWGVTGRSRSREGMGTGGAGRGNGYGMGVRRGGRWEWARAAVHMAKSTGPSSM